MSIYTFQPVYQERIWGGRRLHRLYKRPLPEGKKIGESWEMVDRPEANSLILTGGEKGEKTLHDLWTSKRKAEIFGKRAPNTPRFPILIKLLDCVDKLSLQVHPPASKAAELKGEPKTEMWYFLHATRKAEIYVGLKKGTTRAMFEKAIGTPDLAKLFHVLKPTHGEAMYLPSGRVHAIGAGNLILEIQQNSDTTYRVYDWDRKDDAGKPRELHIKESLASINFNDFEPMFAQPHGERVVECPYFTVEHTFIYEDEYRCWHSDGQSFQYHFLSRGEVTIDDQKFKYGQGWFVSSDHQTYELKPGKSGATLITVRFGR